MIEVYYGNGKGKTTAALGAVLRAGGGGLKPVVAQFLKGMPSGEREWLKRLSVPVFYTPQSVKFFREMSDSEQEVCRRENWVCLKQAADAAGDGCDLLVLDEILDAVELSVLPLSALTDLLDRLTCEVILTGHSLPPEIRRRADYITEMREVRHPYQKGVQARRGIEY